jgi:molecular chaperone Hsp33
VFENAPLRGELVQLGATWRAVLQRRDYPPVLQNLLGELMAAAALLSATIKFEGSLIMQMQGSGPVQLLVVECTSQRTMRATAKWNGMPVGSRIAELLGNGHFVIAIVPDGGKQSYQGVVGLEGETVAQILEHYMALSEQLQTRLWLACNDEMSCGVLLQKLPEGTSPDTDAWTRVVTLGESITRQELLTLPGVQLLHRLYHQERVRVFEPHPVAFRCSCSHDRVTAMLRLLGHAEICSIIAERGSVEVNCDFCGRHYRFDRVDAAQVFAADVFTATNPTRH